MNREILFKLIEQFGNDFRKIAADVYIDDKAVNNQNTMFRIRR